VPDRSPIDGQEDIGDPYGDYYQHVEDLEPASPTFNNRKNSFEEEEGKE